MCIIMSTNLLRMTLSTTWCMNTYDMDLYLVIKQLELDNVGGPAAAGVVV